MRTLIVAVDGVLADTLPMRVAAFRSAAQELDLAVALPPNEAWIAGLDWADAARALSPTGVPPDETMVDLVALAAERALHARLRQGTPFVFPEQLARCTAAAMQGWRVILRTDGSRRAAGAVLEHLMAETTAMRAVAADDAHSASAGRPMLQRQYARIAPLLHATPVAHAVEASPVAFASARKSLPLLLAGWPPP